MTPKVNDKGGKSINVISTQTNRTLSISTPLLMTWGVSDFVDEKGEQDGKFMISLVFPNDDYSTTSTNNLLNKIKVFEDKFLDDAVKNSESWFGEKMSREIVKHMFFPILKYPKNKDTKKFDYTRPPTIKAKVPLYDGKWGVEIFDTKSNLIFPNGDSNMTPMDFIPKGSVVACVLAFSQVWIGGKGMGIQMKLVQCIVKPREVVSVIGKCQISLSDEERDSLTSGTEEAEETSVVALVTEPMTTVCDSDDEKEEIVKPVVVKKVIKKLVVPEPVVVVPEPVVVVPEPVVVVVPEPVVVVVPEPVVVVVPEPVVVVVPEPVVVVVPAPVVVKKVIKKLVVPEASVPVPVVVKKVIKKTA
jgi:hypothetical protein